MLNFFEKAHISKKEVFGVVAISFVISLLAFVSLYEKIIFPGWEQPSLFKYRSSVTDSGKISNNIKILVLDDKTVSWLGSPDLPIDYWAQIFKAIAKKRPRAILYDGGMYIVNDPFGRFEQAKKDLMSLDVGVSTGGFYTDKAIPFRTKMSQDAEFLKKLKFKNASDVNEFAESINFNSDKIHAYGFHKDFEGLFENIGNIAYESNGRIRPVVPLGPRSNLLHLALLPFENEFINNRLYSNSHIVPLNTEGMSLVNYRPFEFYKNNIFSLKPVLAKAFKDKDVSIISEDDIVIIVPAFFTGSGDIYPTPYGYQAGGLFVASLVHDAQRGSWIRETNFQPVLIFIVGVLSALIALSFTIFYSLAAGLLFVLLQIFLSFNLFAFASIVVPWAIPCFISLLVLGWILQLRAKYVEYHKDVLTDAIEDSVKKGANLLLTHPDDLKLTGQERVVTVMFIDIVGFSLIVEHHAPRRAFTELKGVLNVVDKIVKKYGGVINKTLGDGALVFFGYDTKTGLDESQHATVALNCAIELQREVLIKNYEACTHNEPIHPLRIGVHTASIFLGDLGQSGEEDYTLVGNGVNFAKRLEAACSRHMVMISSATHDLLSSGNFNINEFKSQKINIKHYDEQYSAYEYNPHMGSEDMLESVDMLFERNTSRESDKEIFVVKDPHSLGIETDIGPARLVEITNDSVWVEFPKLIKIQSRVRIKMITRNDSTNQLLADVEWNDMECSVVWSYASSERYLHSVMPVNVKNRDFKPLIKALEHHLIRKKNSKTSPS